MATQDFLPENDPDLKLAREIGASLNSGTFPETSGEVFLEQLFDFRESELKEANNNVPSTSLWDRIQESTQNESRILPFYQRGSIRAWAAAAVVLFAAFTGLWWLNSEPPPQLIAESEAEAETVLLEDGSEVILRPYSSLFVQKRNEDQRAYAVSGEAFFDVVSDPDRPFSVDAGAGTITVLGTRFNVSNWGDQTRVFLEEGSVRFAVSPDEFVILEPGESAYASRGELSAAESTGGEQFTDWLNNALVFEGTTSQQVAAEIGQHFNITITIREPDNKTVLDGTLRLDSAEQTLEDLGLVLGGTFRETAADRYTFTPLD